ncbi:MAG: FtsH protease activity modulator HflK [Myxococcota bacterium]
MDFEETIRELRPGGGGGGGGGGRRSIEFRPKWIVWILLASLVAAVAFTSWFQVPANSVGIVLRLGEHVRQAGPGLHGKLPLGIEKVYTVPVEEQLKEEFGFRTVKAGVDSQYAEGDFSQESLMVTGDLNVVDVDWTVQYRIGDPVKYLFRVRHVRDTFRFMTQAVMREVIGDRTVNEVLTVGRTELAVAVQEDLQRLSDQYEMGLRVRQVILQDITPPDPVKPSFNEVNEAQQEREKLINQARAAYNKEIPRAKGEARRTIQQAEGYAVDRVNRSEGEAARFGSIYEEYRRAPEVTRTRMFIETMAEVLPKVRRKIVVDEGSTETIPLVPFSLGARGGSP